MTRATTTEEVDPSTLIYCWAEMDEIGVARVESKQGEVIDAVAVGLSSNPEMDQRMFLLLEPAEARELATRLVEEALHADEDS